MLISVPSKDFTFTVYAIGAPVALSADGSAVYGTTTA